MSRKSIFSIMIAFVFALVAGGIAFAVDTGPATITLPAKKGNVVFEHHKHQAKFKCGECHHGPGHSAYTEGMKIETCDKCHNKDFKVKKLNSVEKAMHKNCKGCHKTHKAEGAPSGSCKNCHKK